METNLNIILYKFFEKEEYQQQFLNGMLYCNTAQWFISCEEQPCGVKDVLENSNFIALAGKNNSYQQRIVQDKNGFMYQFKKTKNGECDDGWYPASFIGYNREKYNIFCMSAIIIDEKGKVLHFDKSNIDNFGEYGVLVTNSHEFISLTEKSLDLNNEISSVSSSLVKYYSLEEIEGLHDWNLFMKLDKFKSQQEYRFVFKNINNNVLQYKLKKDLSEYAVIIKNKKEFYSSINEGQQILSNGN